ncbi:MAG: polysaccharide biosynthesis tyrosine autokinase [Eubacteriales bacterium]|nr:polysaccharide biosynthesis tyrosine autokinase [Eubacteriales bacterium]
MADKDKKQFNSRFGLSVIDWDCLLRDLLHGWWMILLGALTAALLMGGIRELRYQPRYLSSTTFVIGRAGFSYQQIYDNLNQAEQTTKQYAQVVNSSILRTRVCEELGLSSFDASVSVNTVKSTNLMVMSVTADSPRKAFLINRSVRKNALDLMAFFLTGVTMMELEEAQIPTSPMNPLRLSQDVRTAAIAGALLIAALLALISFRKDTIKNTEDVGRKVDTRLLGTIYFEKKRFNSRQQRFGKGKRKTSLLLTNPMLSFGFLESYRMLAARVRLALDRGGKKVLMITSVSENEGKSTVSANLALALAQEGKKVLLMDCDFRSPSLYKIFSAEVSEEEDLTNAIRSRRAPRVGGLKGTPGVFTVFSRRARPKPWDVDSLSFLAEFLQEMRGYVDYILIDTSPMAFVSDSEEYAALADASLLVVRQDLMEACYINDAVDNLEDTGTELIGCVFNGVRRGVVGRARERSHYHGSAYGNYSHYRKLAESGGERK